MITRRESVRLVAGLVLMACGCSTKVTLDNFNKIQPGMPRAEVEAILGPPDQKYQDTIFTWKNGETRTITIVIDDRGMVERKDMEGL